MVDFGQNGQIINHIILLILLISETLMLLVVVGTVGGFCFQTLAE
jgi:hypothetical protein